MALAFSYVPYHLPTLKANLQAHLRKQEVTILYFPQTDRGHP